jgi:DNA topoisomerase-3
MQTEDGKWRTEFDEPWAREGAKPPEVEGEVADGAAPAAAADARSAA